jgi:hypothetical protein
MERLAAAEGRQLATLSPEAWDALWEAAKRSAGVFRADSSPRS